METNLLRFKTTLQKEDPGGYIAEFRAVFDTDYIGANLPELIAQVKNIDKNIIDVCWIGNCIFFDLKTKNPLKYLKVKRELKKILKNYLIKINEMYAGKVILWNA